MALLWQRDRATRLSVEILQLQNIPIVWHYLRDPTYSRFHAIPECDRHTHTDGRTDTALRRAVKIDHIALHTKYNYYGNERRLIANSRQTKKCRLLAHI